MTKRFDTIQIDTDVPVPAITGRGQKSAYPFELMRPGESFFAPVSARNLCRRAYEHSLKMANTVKFACRTVPGGSRCWRIQ